MANPSDAHLLTPFADPVATDRPAARLRGRRGIVVLAVVTAVLAGSSTQTAATRDFVWKATGPQTSIYLVGSVHLLSKDYYPLSPALDAAFKDSDLLVEEVDLGSMLEPESQLRLLTRGMLPPGQSLDQVVSKETFALVSKKLAAIGMPVEPLKQFKPWSLALTLMSLSWANAGFDANLGLDKHFYDLARTDGRLIQGLETLEFQISRFDELPMPQQDRLLADTLKEMDTDTSSTSVTKLADAWKSGDSNTIETLALEDLRQDPEMYQRLLVDRNRNWLPKIEALFNRRGKAFVVVGAAHLVGPDGLLALLKAKGYKVEQL
jgi:uncharacterized protein YbaP (TraB family)